MTATRPVGASGLRASREIAGVVLRSLLTRARLASLGALGLLLAVLGVVGRTAEDPVETTTGILAVLGLSIVAPVVTLVIASASLGDLRDDRSLVYLWLRPIPRWSIAVGAAVASVVVALPLVLVPMVASAVISGVDELIVAAALASVLAVVAYGGVFVALGLQFERAFLWGLAYIIVWEGIVAGFGDGTARLSVRSYTHSVLSRAADVELGTANRGPVTSIVVPLAVGVAGVLWATWRLGRQEVD